MTNRLRYFSFYCWAVDAYERQVHSGDLKRWQVFIRRAEAIYALASNLVDGPQSLGMAGGDWANRMKAGLNAKVGWDTFDLRPHTDRPGEVGQYLKAKGGNFGQFYVASMLEVGMLAGFTAFRSSQRAMVAILPAVFLSPLRPQNTRFSMGPLRVASRAQL